MIKGYKKHIITTSANNKAECLNSIIKAINDAFQKEAKSVSYCGYWDGLQYDHAHFYASDEYMETMKSFIKEFKDFSNIEIIK
jgi:endonuclease IV